MKSSRNALTPAERSRCNAIDRLFHWDLNWDQPRGWFWRAVLRDSVLAGEQGYLQTLDALSTSYSEDLQAWLAQVPAAVRRRLARQTIGHLLPGHHSGAIVSALLPGWLLGCRQLVRPSARLLHTTKALVPAVTRALGKTLPEQTVATWRHDRPGSAARLKRFLAACDIVTVQGSDFTVEGILAARAGLAAREQPAIVAFPHRISVIAWDCDRVLPAAKDTLVAHLGWYWNERKEPTLVQRLAQLMCMGEQLGCLCPQGVVLVGSPDGRARWIAALAEALTRCQMPPRKLAREELLAIGYQHRAFAALANVQAGFAVQELGRGGTRGRLWQVPLSERPVAMTGRSFFLWQADDWKQAGRAIRAWDAPLQAVGSFGPEKVVRAALRQVDAWVCFVTALQYPPVNWPQDGCDLLTRLMRLAEAGA